MVPLTQTVSKGLLCNHCQTEFGDKALEQLLYIMITAAWMCYLDLQDNGTSTSKPPAHLNVYTQLQFGA